MIDRTSVMNVQNKPSERMGSSQWGGPIFSGAKKIKKKPACPRKMLINEVIVA
jgi:hypothetical protein